MKLLNSDVYTLSCKIQGFHSLLYLHHSNNLFENISIFLFAPPQLSSLKKLFLGKKIIGGAFVLPCTPQITYGF